MHVSSDLRRSISESLIFWFSQYGRDFPWRRTNDPYHILIAEKLLQQTAVNKGVEEVFTNFLQRFPTISNLSLANLDELVALITPLGFSYRAEELKRLAILIVSDFNGVIPTDINELLSLPGVGDYTARAILSFAHNKNIPIVDTNIARVLSRVFGTVPDYPQNPARSKKMLALMTDLVSDTDAKIINWAIIDLGSLLCRPKSPQCSKCPISKQCKHAAELEKKC